MSTVYGTLVEIKPGSSIDPNINVVRCLLCKAQVLYFKNASAQASTASLLPPTPQQKQLPSAHAVVYLAKDTKDPQAVEESEKMAEYSEPFGVLLLDSVVGAVRPRAGAHIPRELQQKVSGHMQQRESQRDERVRSYIRAQDEELERERQRTREQCSIVAEIISQVHPQQTAAPASGARKSGGGVSGLAAMLRGGTGGGNSNSVSETSSNPFARGVGSYTGSAGRLHAGAPGSVSDDDFDLDDQDFSAIGVQPGQRMGGLGQQLGRKASGRQSDENSDAERDEGAFGNFDSAAARAGVQTQRAGGNLSQMLAGSMPIQIPMYGSSLTGELSMSRREYHQRADEMEMNRRREQMLRGMPKTFVPPHQLMDSIHENDTDMVIGSKPRDSYGMSRRQAPG
ncbi:hypothetical protein H4R23_001420 [Coemansia sp. Cherry 401B]|nr:hypothetical protein H4R23_001420 [Coemansia sp. Cherry 401B]